MISSLIDLMKLIDEYASYLKARNVLLDDKGFPLLDRRCFLQEWPDRVVPFRDRKSKLVINPKRVVLCFYCDDERIYPRIENVLNDLPEYRKYMGVISSDVTVTADMDIEWQRELMLLNQLFMAVLAVNGIKVVCNLRCGSRGSISCFDAIPSGVMCASGTLGCSLTESVLDMGYLEKLMRLRPSRLLVYGKVDPVMREQIELVGIPYRWFADVHTVMKARRVG